MEALSNKEMQKKRMLTYFIEATQKIIDEEGIEKVSIRKVSKIAGYNSATIYNYFTDVDQLVLLASMKYFKGYTIALSTHLSDYSATKEDFISVWKFFCESAFEHSGIFYNIFFNKHTDTLNDIVNKYYFIFPEESVKYHSDIEQMFTGKNLLDRNYIIMHQLVNSGIIKECDENIINEIIVSSFRAILEEKCLSHEDSNEFFVKKMISIIDFLLSK